MTLIDDTTMHYVKQALETALKGVGVIMLGDLNERLGDPHDETEEELLTALEDRGLVDMTSHFLLQHRYRGGGQWACRMRQEGRHMMEWGDYFLSMSIHNVTNAGLK